MSSSAMAADGPDVASGAARSYSHTGPVREFFDQQTRTVDQAARLVGLAEGWIAPVSFLTATTGFDESAWLDAMPTTVLSVRLSGAAVCCRHGKHQGRKSVGHAPTLQPKGAPNHFTADSRVSFAQIFLADALLDRVADALVPGSSISGRLRDDLAFVDDPEFTNRALAYCRIAGPRSSATALEMEARAILLVERLLGWHHGLAPAPPVQGGLAAWQLRSTHDLLNNAMARQPTLKELAAEVGLSPFHFARSFRASTGLPPYRYLVQLRVERARTLLESTDLPITHIAAAIGYDDPGYFARLFRREVGTTPAAYRRERRA